MYENWIADQLDDAELAKNHAYLLGSFWNPEAVKKLMGDGGNTHLSSDDDMLKSMEMVREANPKEEEGAGKRRKRKRAIRV